jgi:tight adherence protein C
MSGMPLLAALAGMLLVAALGQLGVSARSPRHVWRTLLLALVGGLGRRVGAPGAPRDLDARLAAAGRPLGLRPSDAMALKGGAAALAVASVAPLGALLPGRLVLVAAVVLPAGAFLAPDAWLRRRARRRARAMAAELPDLLDLLRVALAAGLSLDRAFAEVARRDQGLLAREWRAVAAQLELGAPRERALAELVARCPCAGIAPLARALERSFRHGAPLEQTLGALAREARAARARRLAERAARAAPQIQLVVALLLVPSVLLLVAAALLASLLR